MVVYGSSSNSSQREFILQSLLLTLILQAHTTTMSLPTTPTKRGQFTPSRPAPPPPSYTSSQRSQNGPFTPYAPYHHQGYSSTSLDSASTLYTDPSTPSTFSRQAARSPLNTLLSSPTRPRQAHSIRSISYPSAISNPSAINQSPRYLPAELALFDHKPRQTLLADIELIIGKKLHFPMLSPKRKEKKEKAQVAARESGKLRKESIISEEDIFWSGVRREDVVVIEKKKGRGVREGNWV
jgi:hypothetical protein